MSDTIIVLTAALGSALITGVFTWLAGRDSKTIKKGRKEIVELAEQVKSYYQLEAAYLDYLTKNDNEEKARATIQKEFRSKVEEVSGCKRPTMTAKKANKILNYWQ